MAVKVGINGFGRIGRVVFRTCLQNPELQVAAINDPAIDAEYVCYLIKFDSTHGKFNGSVTLTNEGIKVNDQLIKVFHEKLPSNVPWQTVGVEYVVEASGMFTTLDKASGHLARTSVKRVIVTAPSVDVPMIILGVNDNKLNIEQKVLSCASSTLYCLAPIVKVLEDKFGVAEGFITSIHAMTPSLKPLDGLCLRGKHWRDHRSIHQNIIPATTGACKALGKIIPRVKDKLTGLAFRVPIVNVSVLDLTVRLDTDTTLQDIIKTVEKVSKSNMENIIKISSDQAVSSDFLGDNHSCILDTDSSLQLKPNFYKIVCWYENEYSHACRIVDSILFSEKQFHGQQLLSLTLARPKLLRRQEREIKDISLRCSCNSEISTKIVCSTSQDAGFKRKTLSRPVILKKPISSHTTHTVSSVSTRETKKRNIITYNEIFKIWNDNTGATNKSSKNNRKTYPHSYVAESENYGKSDCNKTQERLEYVKKEFSKMVNITEDLLKKSLSNKFQFSSLATTSKEDVEYGAMELDSTIEHSKTNCVENVMVQRSNPNDVCGDYEDNCGGSNVKATNHSVKERKFERSFERKHFINDSVPVKSNTYEIKAKNIVNRNLCTCNIISERNTSKAEKNTSPQESNQVSDCSFDFKEQVAKTITTLIDGLSQNMQSCNSNDENESIPPNYSNDLNNKELVADEVVMKIIDTDDNEIPDTKTCNTQSQDMKKSQVVGDATEDIREKLNMKDLIKYIHSENNNMRIIDEQLKKRNITLVSSQKYDGTSDVFSTLGSERMTADRGGQCRHLNLKKRILESLDRFGPDPDEDTSGCVSPGTNMLSNVGSKQHKQDIYDKLDSASATDSNDSFEVNERKSQVLHITDLSNSIEDLARLDKICRIIEISDELSDRLFSSLDNYDGILLQKNKWSFKEFCEKIKLDDFCNHVFGKTNL